MALIDHFIPSLAFAAMLASEETLADTPFETARADMDGLLDRAMAAAGAQTPHLADNALFAVCAFADEAVLDSAWPGRNAWMRHKLQEARFHTGNAGVEFYERLERLADAITAAPSETAANAGLREALEVYAACLTLGFRGQFGGDQVKARVEQLFGAKGRLLMGSGLPDGRIFPESYAAALPEAAPARIPPALKGLILFGGPLLAAAGIYAAYAYLLSAFVRGWLEKLG